MKWTVRAGACGLLLLCVGCGDDTNASATPSPDAGDAAPEADSGEGGGGGNAGAGGNAGSPGDASPADAEASTPDADAGAPEVEYQTVSLNPLPAETPLNNPGIGIEQACRLITPTGDIHVNASVESISTVRYIRLQWSLLEKDGDDVWNWNALDAAIEDAVSHGKQAAIAVMGYTPKLGGPSNYTQAVPAWYMAAAEARGPRCTGVGNGEGVPAGCTYYRTDFKQDCTTGETCEDLWTFNHNDPVFIEEQVELIDALRQRYDSPAWAGKIAYVDVRGGLGAWSELHVEGVYLAGTNTRWPMPSWAGKKAVADAYLAFEYLPVIANVRNGSAVAEATDESMWVYLCQQAESQDKTVGWRTDGLDSTKWLMDPVFSAYPGMEDCWRRGPVYGELTNNDLNAGPVEGDPWAGGAKGYFALNERLAAWHVSGWNTKYKSYPGDPASYGDALDAWRSFGGYRLAVTTATIPSTVGVSDSFDAEVQVVNTGTAPVYRDYYELTLRLHPTAGGEDLYVPLQGDLTEVMPGDPATTLTAAASQVDVAGTYEAWVGVVQDPAYTHVLPLKLANEATACETVGDAYWCRLGTVVVTSGS